MINRGTSKVSKIFRGTNKVKYIYRGTTKVWSGASVVSYYDGNTLIGTEEIDEGLDVLHPSFSTAKEGYTLYGWSDSPNSDVIIPYRTATGDAMNLYAIYLPNTLLVASGTVVQGLWTSYSQGIKNDKYISGGLGCTADRAGYYAGGGGVSASTSFNLALGAYRKATIAWGVAEGQGSFHAFYVDGVNVGYSAGSKQVTSGGTHTLATEGNTPNDSWTSTTIGITSITLSEPIAWE